MEGQVIQQTNPQGSGIDGILNRGLTFKNILIGAGVTFFVWYFLKQSKDKAYNKAMLESQKSPLQVKTNEGGITKDQLSQIRENLHEYITAASRGNSEVEVRNTVMNLTTV